MGKDSLKNLDGNVQNILQNNYVCWGLRIVLVLYAAMVAPNLNREVANIFDNVVIRLVVACLIVFLSFHDTTLAILLAIAFVVSIQTLNKHKVDTITSLPESFMNQGDEPFEDQEGNDMEDNNENFKDHAPPGENASQEEKDSFADYERFMNSQNENFTQHENPAEESTNESFSNFQGNENFMHTSSENENFMGHQTSENENFMGHQTSENENFMGHETSENENFMGHETSENENFMGHQTSENENFMGHETSENENFANPNFNSNNCGGPNNQFTTQAQLFDIGNNMLNQNQNNSVSTFCPSFNPQGGGEPSAFDSNPHASF